MNDTDTSLPGHGDGHAVLCYRIHAGAHKRDVQFNLLCQMCGQVYLVGNHF